MLAVISPAKKLDMSVDARAPTTVPDFATDAATLAGVARDLTHDELRALMSISPALAELNAKRFADFGKQPIKAAALAFAGDTYQGLEAPSLEEDEMAWAQNHLRILSGLYGVLRPMDAIEPYRLEMGSRLKTDKGRSLYEYWGTRLADALNAQADATGSHWYPRDPARSRPRADWMSPATRNSSPPRHSSWPMKGSTSVSSSTPRTPRSVPQIFLEST